MPHGPRHSGLRSFVRDSDAAKQSLHPRTVSRILQFARPYAPSLSLYLGVVVLDAASGTINPLIYREIINRGILTGNTALVVELAFLAGLVACADAAFTFIQRSVAARIGQDMLLAMRTRVFAHIESMSLAFFSRAKTGALVSRLNNDVSGVSDAFTDILSGVVSNIVTVSLVLSAMFALSGRLTLLSLLLVPLFVIPARMVGKKLQSLTRERYDLTSEMTTMMIERFSVSGAQLAKVFGSPAQEEQAFRERAKRVRDVSVRTTLYARVFFVALGLTASLAVAVAYGWGGVLAITGALDVGTVVAIASYLLRLYGPLTALSNVQVDVMTALVSFDRVFEILDLQPMVAEASAPAEIPPGPASVEFSHVSFHYPSPSEVSLASLESVASLSVERERGVLSDVSFMVEVGTMTALVGPSGAGKTTITQLIPRFYDPQEGAVRINGIDVREASFDSLRSCIGVVSQEAHMFHDTVRANLRYAKPDATEDELKDALRAAQILPLVEGLPQGLDTVIGERGYRLSGGEKQRLAIARVLLKAPSVVILDEATAHLDSESEAAIQEAFQTALAGRTSIVIAHRLSTVRHAQQILVVNEGKIAERGTHEELLELEGVYATLYRTQFAR